MKKIHKKMIDILLEEKEFISIRQISDMLGYSEKYMINVIMEFQQESDEMGIFLEINNKREIKPIISDIIKFQKNYNQDTDSEELIRKVLKTLIDIDDYIRIDDLAERFFLSRSSMERVLENVRQMGKEYGLEIISRSKHGIRINGSELNKRSCGVRLSCSEDVFANKTFKVQEILYSTLQKYNYSITDINLNNLVCHILVALERIKKGNYILEPVELKNDYKLQIEMAKSLKVQLEESFGIRIPKEEQDYFVLHLLGKKVIKDNNEIDEEIFKLTDKILERIYNDLSIDLRDDFELKIRFCLHMQPLLYRLRYKLKQENPLLQRVKREFPEGYHMAMIAKKVIFEEYGLDMSEEEAAFLAVHFSVALMEEKNQQKKRLKFVIICSTGKGSARLVAYKLSSKFDIPKEDIHLSSLIELKNMDLSFYDCIISSVPINFEVKLPIIYLSPLFDDDAVIEQFILQHRNEKLGGNILKKELFFNEMKLNSKEEVLKFIVEKCSTYFPEEKICYQDLWEREKMGSTEVGNQCCMPHPLAYFSNQPITIIVVLRKPIKWNKEKVQNVFFNVFPKECQERENYVEKLTELICSKSKLYQFGKNPVFENFIEILENC